MGRWRGDRPVPYQHLAILKHAVAMRPIVLHNEERKASRAEVKSSQIKALTDATTRTAHKCSDRRDGVCVCVCVERGMWNVQR